MAGPDPASPQNARDSRADAGCRIDLFEMSPLDRRWRLCSIAGVSREGNEQLPVHHGNDHRGEFPVPAVHERRFTGADGRWFLWDVREAGRGCTPTHSAAPDGGV